MPDPILNELVAYLRWPVQRTGEAYCIRFDYQDLMDKRINGVQFLSMNGYDVGPCLTVSSFDAVPILFQMTQRSVDDPSVITEIHYHTLRGNLHRDGKPARYEFSPVGGLTVRLQYFLNGVHHYADGPADMLLHGIETRPLQDEHGNDLFGPFEMRLRKLELAWFYMGMSGKYPNPSKASLEDVVALYGEQGSYSDFGDRPAFQARNATWWRSASFIPADELVPYWLKIENLQESYQNGELKSRTGSFMRGAWARGPNDVGTLETFPPDYLMNHIGLWSGPFAPDPTTAVKLEQEFAERMR